MKLYLLTSNKRPDWDSYLGHVIAAESPEQAVTLAQLKAADEGQSAWDIKHIKVIADETNQPAGIVLSDFNAG